MTEEDTSVVLTQDPGSLLALITMNFLTLKPGEALYIPADGIHAYLSGDIVECMARSNNVLNTGFCPRADRNSVESFVSCLTFTPHSAEEAMLPSTVYKGSKNGFTRVYAPPMSEFNMLHSWIPGGNTEGIDAIEGPSVLICVSSTGQLRAEGKVHELKEGYIFFVGQGVDVEFAAKDSLLEVFMVYVD